ncbi:hypothetical protein [Bradyrhizobium elkanii]|nr:hypothetical protein [Bradyrhizobium elkanii]
MALHKIPVEAAVSAGVFQEANKAIEEGELHLVDRLKRRAQEEEEALEAA